MADKIPNMVATVAKRTVGRPRKFGGAFATYHVKLPLDLAHAVEAHRNDRAFDGPADALRDLIREGATSLGLVKPK